MKKEDIDRLFADKIFASIDIYFARLMGSLADGSVPELMLASALVSSRTRQGDICLDLSGVQGRALHEIQKITEKPYEPDEPNESQTLVCPELDLWRSKLEESFVVGKPGEFKPLILDDKSRLYLYRYWEYQEKLAVFIKKRVCREDENIDLTRMKHNIRQGMKRLFFKNRASKNTNWQAVAAFAALTKKFCVISGGPGTGKTTTIAKILALLLELKSPERLKIALAAPTGKAAARLKQSVKFSKDNSDFSETIKGAIPEEVSTVHRLLGSIKGSPYFRYNAENNLPADIVVVDEASMVDLALMSKLVQSLAGHTSLILLGDKDQLSSVEAGAVLGDICDAEKISRFSGKFCKEFEAATGNVIDTGQLPYSNDKPGLCDSVVQLQQNYRFGDDSGIGAVSRAVNNKDATQAATLLKNGKRKDIQWKRLPGHGELVHAIRDTVKENFTKYLKAGGISSVFDKFAQFKIFCAIRQGPFGVVAVNSAVEQILKDENMIKPGVKWYHGRPVLITRNDYNLRLFNGDVGIVLADHKANNELCVVFPEVDGTYRKLHPLRLPEHETVYAMTVHKSQGSEFNKILLILPDIDTPVLTRELIYTGITRARESVEIWCDEDIFHTAVSRGIKRASGLWDLLRKT